MSSVHTVCLASVFFGCGVAAPELNWNGDHCYFDRLQEIGIVIGFLPSYSYPVGVYADGEEQALQFPFDAGIPAGPLRLPLQREPLSSSSSASYRVAAIGRSRLLPR